MSLHILVLAAGEGRRFGGAVKQLAKIGDKTLLEHALGTASKLAPSGIHVVLGFCHEQLAPLAGNAQVIINSHWQDGLGSSIACGVAALPASACAVLIMLGDQPALSSSDLNKLIERFEHARETGLEPIVCASYADGLGVPAIFPKRFFKQLMALEGDKGAKQLLGQHPVISVPLANAAVDIDTQEQWARYSARPL